MDLQCVQVTADSVDTEAFRLLGRDYLAELLCDRLAEEREAFLQSMLDRQGEPDRWLLLLKAADEPVGFIHAKIDHDDRPGWRYILEFYIRPEKRKSGLGQILCEHMLRLFSQRGIKDVWLASNRPPRDSGARSVSTKPANSTGMVYPAPAGFEVR